MKMESYKNELLFDQFQNFLINKKTAPVRGYNSNGSLYYNIMFLKDGKIMVCYHDAQNPEGWISPLEFEVNYQNFKHVYLSLCHIEKFTEEEMNLPF